MAKDREIQKLWNQELKKLNSKIYTQGAVNLLKYDKEWAGTITLGTQANFGTGSSISINIGACWYPHDALLKEIAPKYRYRCVSYADPLYEYVPAKLRDQVGTWRIQDAPESPINFALPLECLEEYGFPVMENMCNTNYALSKFRERSYQPSTGAGAWVSYVIALEITGNHQQAIKELELFLKKNEAEGKFASSDFSLFASKFYEKFGR